MIKCLKCGKCCFIKESNKYCKYLIRLKNGKTLCRIYNNRIKTKIHSNPDKYCGMREWQTDIIDGCPYNEVLNNENKQKSN